MKHLLLAFALVGTSAFAFEPPKDQECVEVQRECQPDAKALDGDRYWYLSADCSVRVVKQGGRGQSYVTDIKPEPKYECHPKKEELQHGS